ncbi:DUF1330 domain-containing protein [Microbulbifer hainanensis]|uniref:DUF1330 domain-containing protein n=1 Tax=Microbulbifer hainanensis TaxID=2735675 RepID=UPI001D02D90E|nr:DUF1330 domain-containing protein [Microbulbifer hainanensis]
MTHLAPTDASAVALFRRELRGEVVMLNLLRLRQTADYSAHPALYPQTPISGREAFQRYIDHTLPLLRASGGELLFLGEGGAFFIGPQDEQWDLAMLVRQRSVQSFIDFATDDAYLAIAGHREAALVDSRLLPLQATGNGLSADSVRR